MIGLTAVVLGLSAVAYAAWPWLRGRPPAPAMRRRGEGELRRDENELRHEEVEEYVNALREQSLAAGEIGLERKHVFEVPPTAGVEDG